MILDAIKRAPTEHVVQFLLTSYLDTRAHHAGRNDSPLELRQFPVSEAVAVVTAAAEQIARLRRPPPADIATRRRVFGAQPLQ